MKCPNCITSWRCNALHLIKVSDTVYKSEHGYFMINNLHKWVWLPNDKEYTFDNLLSIMDTLQKLGH